MPRVMASSAMGVFGFLPTTHAKANVKQVRSQSSRPARLLACDCFYAQPAVHAINLRTLRTTIIFTTGKTRRPQFEPHARIKVTQGLVSPSSISVIVPNVSYSFLFSFFQERADKSEHHG